MRATRPLIYSIGQADGFAPGCASAIAAGAVMLGAGAGATTIVWLLLTVAIVGIALPLGRYPLHQMGLAQHVVEVLIPVAGIAVFAAPSLVGFHTAPMRTIMAALVAAIVARIGANLAIRVLEERTPLRIGLVGGSDLARMLAFELRESHMDACEVVGYIAVEGVKNGACSDGALPFLGGLGQLREIVERTGVDVLVLGPEVPRLAAFEELVDSCLDLSVRVIELNSLYEQFLAYVPVGTINAAWFQYMMYPTFVHRHWQKRLFDLVVGGAVAAVALPLVGLLAMVVRLWDGGPVFYRQRRVGEGGSEFDIVKLRTMVVDAEARGRPMWSDSEDARVTGIGRLLRRLHLDELPQIFNVLKGEMTLVGPRPERPEIVEALEETIPYYTRRHLVAPGVTGWAQVRCGYANTLTGSAWKMGYDLYYLKHRSLAFDLLILVETVYALAVGSHRMLQVPPREIVLSESAAGPAAVAALPALCLPAPQRAEAPAGAGRWSDGPADRDTVPA